MISRQPSPDSSAAKTSLILWSYFLIAQFVFAYIAWASAPPSPLMELRDVLAQLDQPLLLGAVVFCVLLLWVSRWLPARFYGTRESGVDVRNDIAPQLQFKAFALQLIIAEMPSFIGMIAVFAGVGTFWSALPMFVLGVLGTFMACPLFERNLSS